MEETRSLINASPAEVWEVLADIGNWPTWAQTAADLVVGTIAELKQPKIPTAIWTVTSVEPERGFTWSSRSNGVVTTAEHELHPMDSGTEVALRITHTDAMAFLARLFGGRMTRSYLKQEAEGLKARVEQGRSRK
jgi:uncharacterized protein YndB with AHSA1/START domain